MLLQGLGCAIGVEGVVTKAIDVLGLVRTECSQSFRVRGVTFMCVAKRTGHGGSGGIEAEATTALSKLEIESANQNECLFCCFFANFSGFFDCSSVVSALINSVPRSSRTR
jgi:hypothetical protein